jgi:hypothetical protein
MANEISQTQKGKYYMVLFICGSKNVEFIWRMMVTRGKGVEEKENAVKIL